MAGASSRLRAGSLHAHAHRAPQARIHRWPSARRMSVDAEPAGPVVGRAGDARAQRRVTSFGLGPSGIGPVAFGHAPSCGAGQTTLGYVAVPRADKDLRAAGGAVTVPSFSVVAPCASPDRPAPPAGASQARLAHQAFRRACGGAVSGAARLIPFLQRPVDLLVGLPDARYRCPQLPISARPRRPVCLNPLLRLVQDIR